MSPYEQLKLGKAQRKRRGFYYTCQMCGKEFYVTPARAKDTAKHGIVIRYCSRACYDQGKFGEGNPFWGKKHSPESVAKMIANPNRRRFDSSKDQIQSKNDPRLISNPNFVKFGYLPHKDSSPKRWRRALIEKRGAKCEKCGYDKCAPILELHHIDSDKKNNSDDNLVILCPTCHEEKHFTERTGKFGSGAGHHKS